VITRLLRLLAIALLLAQSVGAVAVTKDQFGYGLIVSTDGSGAVYEVRLPDDVYAVAQRRDLGDVRVFNADGEPVPHALRRPEPATAPAESVVVPLFPLYGEGGTPVDVAVTTAEDGSITEIVPRGGALIVENAQIVRYVVDLSGISRRIDALEIDLLGVSPGFINAIRVNDSDDLDTWRTIVDRSTLTYLDYGGHLLRRNEISFEKPVRRYLNLAWERAPDGVQIGTVRARLEPERQDGGFEWLSPAGVHDRHDETGFLYDSGGVFPVERLNLGLPQVNSLFDAEIFSRSDTAAAWRRVYSGAFYSLNVQGFSIDSSAVATPVTSDRYWRVVVRGVEAVGAQVPQLALGWRGATLLFVARGRGPFTIAFGSAMAEPAPQPERSLLNILKDDEQGLLLAKGAVAERVTLGGDAALVRHIRVDARKALLWTILVVAVLALIWMAWDLMRQMRRPPAADE